VRGNGLLDQCAADIDHGFAQIGRGALGHLVGVQVGRAQPRLARLGGRERRRHGHDDALRELLLDREDVLEHPVELLCPHVRTGERVEGRRRPSGENSRPRRPP